MSGQNYRAIMSLPLCMPIRPQRSGWLLARSHYLQMLCTLKLIHEHHMYNGDIKPSNVLLHNDIVVMCDWGSAVFGTEDAELQERSVGTVGYSDFTLREPAIPAASHDLMALVRTVYANYTHQAVPGNQEQAEKFWAQSFRNGSMWSAAMDHAKELDYAKLEQVFRML